MLNLTSVQYEGDDSPVDRENQQMAVVQFIVQGSLYCANIEQISRVLPLVSLQEMPSMPNYFMGMMNLHGRFIPVIDLALRLGISLHTPYALNTPILICANELNKIGIIVERVLGIARFHPTELQLSKINADEKHIKGTVALKEGNSLLIDMLSLMDPGG